MRIFCNPELDLAQSIITSPTDESTKAVKPLFYGDILPLEIQITDGGAMPELYKNAIISVAIGNPATDEQFLIQNFRIEKNNEVAFHRLNLDTQAFDDLTANKESTAATIEIQAIITNTIPLEDSVYPANYGYTHPLPKGSFFQARTNHTSSNFNLTEGELYQITDVDFKWDGVTYRYHFSGGKMDEYNMDIRGLHINQNQIKTIHQSTIEIRNQMLAKQNIVLTPPAAPSEVQVLSLPIPADPSDVEIGTPPANPSDIQSSVKHAPDNPSDIEVGILPDAPSEVTAVTEMEANAITDVEAFEVAQWSWFGQSVYSPLKIKIEETTLNSLDGIAAQFLKGKTFVWDGSEMYEHATNYGGSSYTGSPVWRAGGEQPGTLDRTIDATEGETFRLFAADAYSNGSSYGHPAGKVTNWYLEYPRPAGMQVGGGIGRTTIAIGEGYGSRAHDPAFHEKSYLRLGIGNNPPVDPEQVTAANIPIPPEAPSEVTAETEPQPPSLIEPETICYEIDASQPIEVGTWVMALTSFGLNPVPHNTYSQIGEIFRITYIWGSNQSHPIQIRSINDSSRFTHVTATTTNQGKERGKDWETLKTGDCTLITGIAIKVDHGTGNPANGYYSVFNPRSGYYNSQAIGYFQETGSLGASAYKKVKNLDCSQALTNYYLYRAMWTGSDFIVTQWKAASMIAISNDGTYAYSAAGTGASPITNLSQVSVATTTACQILNAGGIGEKRKVTAVWTWGANTANPTTSVVNEILEVLAFYPNDRRRKFKRANNTEIFASETQYNEKTTYVYET